MKAEWGIVTDNDSSCDVVLGRYVLKTLSLLGRLTGLDHVTFAKLFRFISVVVIIFQTAYDFPSSGTFYNVVSVLFLLYWIFAGVVSIGVIIPMVEQELSGLSKDNVINIGPVTRMTIRHRGPYSAMALCFAALSVTSFIGGANVIDRLCSIVFFLTWVLSMFATTIFGPKPKSVVTEAIESISLSRRPLTPATW